MVDWSVAAPAILAAFLAAIVEIVEAFTIVLVVATVRGWRPAVAGTAAALALLSVVVVTLGPLLAQFPIEDLQLMIGLLLLLFGMGWLRKAVLRAGGVVPLHDEAAVFTRESAALSAEVARKGKAQDWLAGILAFKAVLLEGIEVIFIVLAVGTGHDLLWPAALGALAAAALVLVAGAVAHRPLSRVPENALKFGVGVMTCAFGVFWTGEALGVAWPGEDLALLPLAGVFLGAGLLVARGLRGGLRQVAR